MNSAGRRFFSFCIVRIPLFAALLLLPRLSGAQTPKPAITLDEFLNTTEIQGAKLSPDGTAAVIGTESPDWKANNFRHVLWLWTAKTGLRPLTQGGSDEGAEWSPDGQWIAFLSDRPLIGAAHDEKEGDADSDGDAKAKSKLRADGEDDKATRLWLISASGGEAQPLYREKLDVHAFIWSPDSRTLYFSTQLPLSKEKEEANKKDWKDVVRWREKERGDLILALPIAMALRESAALPPAHEPPGKEEYKSPPELIACPTGEDDDDKDPKLPLPVTAVPIAKSNLSINDIAASPDGESLAFTTESVSHRTENPADFEIFSLPAVGGKTVQITHNEALESGLHWSPDSKALYFAVHAAGGSLEGKYRDVQGRLYRMDMTAVVPVGRDKPIERLGADFTGSLEDFDILPDGQMIALGLKGTEEQLYKIAGTAATRLPGFPGTYSALSGPRNGNSLLVRYSAINYPPQIFMAADAMHPDKLTALTEFNPIFAKRAQPEWRPYSWTAPDGAKVEGVLIFPPGKKDAKKLKMLTFIHGGPADADGNRFGADWYDWATLAASQGWLVFRPNYRGSSGYGDDFMLGIAPHLVSVPGADILAGVDALVKDGFADPDKLAIGGYSYGGYMTNWLITETTRFKAAVTGAGAVEHAANWGNDDVTWDDAWYLGGRPWEVPGMYQSEAALFRMDRVKTPTHIVQGGSDVRVSFLEGVTLERALQQLGIPHTFLVFPGEGHGLGRNPWHGYIKLRDELLWLDQYDK